MRQMTSSVRPSRWGTGGLNHRRIATRPACQDATRLAKPVNDTATSAILRRRSASCSVARTSLDRLETVRSAEPRELVTHDGPGGTIVEVDVGFGNAVDRAVHAGERNVDDVGEVRGHAE
jgi:hypothetical protein